MLNIFVVPIIDLCIFFEEMIIQTIAHFGGIDLFLLLSCRNYFYILDSKLIYIWFANTLSYYVSCLFIFLILSFDEKTFSILVNSNIHQNEFFKWWIWCIYFFVCFPCFWYLRSHWQIQDHKDLPLCFIQRFLWFNFYI